MVHGACPVVWSACRVMYVLIIEVFINSGILTMKNEYNCYLSEMLIKLHPHSY